MMKQGKTLLAVFTSLIVYSCSPKQDLGEGYSIDLTVQYKNALNSFNITPSGEATVLINELDKPGVLYRASFNEQEMDSIQNVLSAISFNKCDTVQITSSDGGYVMNIENKNGKKKLVSNTCEQLKPLDNLVFFIIKSFRSKKKKEYYESLKTITPPPFPVQ